MLIEPQLFSPRWVNARLNVVLQPWGRRCQTLWTHSFLLCQKQTQLLNDTSALFKALFCSYACGKMPSNISGVLSEEFVGHLEWSGDATLASNCGRMLYLTPGLLSDHNCQVAIWAINTQRNGSSSSISPSHSGAFVMQTLRHKEHLNKNIIMFFWDACRW